jgi:hypothetical protein
MVERVTSSLRGLERNRELLLQPGLADELVEFARPEASLDLLLVIP